MKYAAQHRVTLIAFFLSVALLCAGGVAEYGRRISSILPCTTDPYSSAYCYSTYDAVIYMVLGLIIVGSVIGLALDFIRSWSQKRD